MVSGFDLHDELEQGQAIDAERFERLAKEAFVAPSKMGARILGIQLRASTRPLQPICVRCSSLAYSATKSTTTKSGDFMIATMNSGSKTHQLCSEAAIGGDLLSLVVKPQHDVNLERGR